MAVLFLLYAERAVHFEDKRQLVFMRKRSCRQTPKRIALINEVKGFEFVTLLQQIT